MGTGAMLDNIIAALLQGPKCTYSTEHKKPENKPGSEASIENTFKSEKQRD